MVYHLLVFAAVVLFVTALKSYTTIGRKILKLSFLHNYWTKFFQKFLYQVIHQGQDKRMKKKIFFSFTAQVPSK